MSSQLLQYISWQFYKNSWKENAYFKFKTSLTSFHSFPFLPSTCLHFLNDGWKVRRRRCLKKNQMWRNFKRTISSLKLHAQIWAYKEYKFLLFFASHSSQRYNTLVCLQWKWISVSRTVNEGIENSKNFFYYDNHLNEATSGVHNLICYNFAVLSSLCIVVEPVHFCN